LFFYRFVSFSMPPRLPCSTLFPYTTLFRSLTHLHFLAVPAHACPAPRYRDSQSCQGLSGRLSGIEGRRSRYSSRRNLRAARSERSEEHTSELQSRENLVCRLLLEKKKM